jgi:hypothetical protein
MHQKRTVFLFGSGAALEWNSPTTSELTKLIKETGFKTTDNKTTITEFIYQTLRANDYSDSDVNFETIISVIEELIVYYSQSDPGTKIPSLLSCFLRPRFEKELLNYSIEGGTAKHGYQLQIPADLDYCFSKAAYRNETTSQSFFQQLLLLLLTTIAARIHEYAYHTATHSVISVDSDTSKSFTAWMKLLSANSILRLYTLNYERVFQILLARAGVSVFEGFHCEEHIGHDITLRADVRKILSDNESHIHYNLHGSVFWGVRDLDWKQLPNPEIVASYIYDLPLTNNPVSVQIEKGKTLLVTSIVTGYQKAQRGMMAPFKQMQAAFDRDCCFADEIYVIGYSFGDEHINESMKTAIRHNQNVKINIVDPQFFKNEMELKLALELFPFRQENNMKKERIRDDLYRYFGGTFTVHTITFKEFLKSQLLAGSS